MSFYNLTRFLFCIRTIILCVALYNFQYVVSENDLTSVKTQNLLQNMLPTNIESSIIKNNFLKIKLLEHKRIKFYKKITKTRTNNTKFYNRLDEKMYKNLDYYLKKNIAEIKNNIIKTNYPTKEELKSLAIM